MRILHIITNLKTGGAEKLLIDSLPLYKKKGIDVDLLLLDGKDTDLKKELVSKGVKIYSLGEGSVYNPINILKIMSYLKKYDIIHVHLFPTLYWVSIAKMFSFSKTKILFTEHNTFNNRLNKPLWSFMDQIIYKQYSKIVSITEEVEKIIKAQLRYKNGDKFSVITNGIDLSKFNKNFSQNIDLSKNRNIIQVSSFDSLRKDQITLIKAMKNLSANIHLLLVGDGCDRKYCEDLVKELKLEDRVKFLGIRNDIPELLEYSDIVVQSSHYEGFGLAALEGMASCKPVVASDVPGLSAVVGGAGLLFPVGNAKELGRIIEELLTNDDLYKQIADKCLERSKMYDINTMVDKYIELYKSLIEK